MPSGRNKVTADYEEVFKKYLEICNQSIEHNKNKFPYTEVWGAHFEALEKEAILDAVIYDDRPKLSCKLRLTPDMKIEIVGKNPIKSEDEWPFKYQYLKRVVDNPKEYIKNPAKLEWGWLREVFGSVKKTP